jgi:hypothetical protein
LQVDLPNIYLLLYFLKFIPKLFDWILQFPPSLLEKPAKSILLSELVTEINTYPHLYNEPRGRNEKGCGNNTKI